MRQKLHTRKERKNWLRFFRALLLTGFFLVLPQFGLADVRGDYFQQVTLDGGREVAAMLKQGVSPNLTELKRHDTGIILALRENSMRVFHVLLNAKGVDLNHRARNGDTALMIAAWQENVAAAQALIDRGARVNQRGWTALHYAAARGSSEIVKLLLAKNADINARSPRHLTPLMMAARNGKIYTVKLLLDNGADPLLADAHGRTMIDWALVNGHTDIANGMKQRMEKSRHRKVRWAEEHIIKKRHTSDWEISHLPPMK